MTTAKSTSTLAKTPVRTTPTPVVPTPPSSWTVSSVITYGVAFALFLFGVLTQAGVTVPAHVSTEVQVWAGAASEIVSALTALSTHVTNSSLVKFLASLGSD